MKKKNKKRLIAICIVVLLLAAGGLTWYLLMRDDLKNYTQTTVKQGKIETFISYGNVYVDCVFEITSDKSGTLQSMATVGTAVKKGDVVAVLADGTELNAPIDGIISLQYYAAGSSFSAKSKLMQIMDYTAATANIKVSEYDIARIAEIYNNDTDNEIMITYNSLTDNGRKLTSGNARFASLPITGSSGSFTVKINLNTTEAHSQLAQGMSIQVRVLKERKEGVLYLPTSAIIVDESNIAYVYVMQNGDLVRKNLSLGLSNGSVTEIKSGLSLDDITYKPVRSTTRDFISSLF